MRFLVTLALALSLAGCGYNTIQQKDEAANAAWSQVLNVYKRRADLIPNLVATVQGYATHERDVLVAVTEARARVGGLTVNPADPASVQQFEAAQGQLQGALQRLLVVTENYPQLKADQGFLNLQAQLEGTENRITVERQRYIEAVQDYNTYIRQFPQNLTAKALGAKPRANFTVADAGQIQNPPTVNFGTGATPRAPSPSPSPAPAPGPAAAPAPASGSAR